MKWYKRYNTWNTVLMILTPIASGEILAMFAHIELPTWVHIAVGIASGLVLYLKMFLKDDNHNGIVDKFENNETTKES